MFLKLLLLSIIVAKVIIAKYKLLLSESTAIFLTSYSITDTKIDIKDIIKQAPSTTYIFLKYNFVLRASSIKLLKNSSSTYASLNK